MTTAGFRAAIGDGQIVGSPLRVWGSVSAVAQLGRRNKPQKTEIGSNWGTRAVGRFTVLAVAFPKLNGIIQRRSTCSQS